MTFLFLLLFSTPLLLLLYSVQNCCPIFIFAALPGCHFELFSLQIKNKTKQKSQTGERERERFVFYHMSRSFPFGGKTHTHTETSNKREEKKRHILIKDNRFESLKSIRLTFF